MEKIRTNNSESWVDGDILYINMHGEPTASDIEKVAKIGKRLCEEHKNVRYNLVDISGVKMVPLSARKMAFHYSSLRAKKMAFICTNPVARIIGSFFMRRYKLPLPTKMFSNIGAASNWLREKKS